VKVIYGAFEKLVYAIVEKFNLDSLRRAPSDAAKVREYFALQLSDPNIADDPKKRDAIIDMMKELGVKAYGKFLRKLQGASVPDQSRERFITSVTASTVPPVL
jgi:hypothetical protein